MGPGERSHPARSRATADAAGLGDPSLYAVGVTTTPPSGPASGPDASATARANAGARARVLGWARRSIDLVPTSWLVTGVAGVLLATTAVFGGLETAPAEPLPALAVGDAYSGSDLSMTIVGVELRDDPAGTGAYPDEEKGERVLVAEVDVVNDFSAPRSALGGPRSPVVDGISLRGYEGAEGGPAVARADDGDVTPVLQPDVPARLLVSWVVGADDFRDGDEVVLTLPDSTHYVGSSVVSGDYWYDTRVGATVTAVVEEVTGP